MKLVVGLGNPGEKYQNSRHNVGFRALDALLAYLHKQSILSKDDHWKLSTGTKAEYIWFDVDNARAELIKPQTFMNKSGDVVGYVIQKYSELSPADILVVHDEMSFAAGEYKFSFKKEANSHNGVQSIIDMLGTNEFWRLRVGVGGAQKETRDQDAAEYVLSSPSYWENRKIKQLLTTELPEQILLWIQGKIN